MAVVLAEDLGRALTGYALAPLTVPSLWDIVRADAQADDASIIADIREPARLRAAVEAADPQVVFHLAAQALVRESYADPLATFATNVLGTGALLEACRGREDLECVVVVTSDKVYENRGAGRPFEEGDRLGGHDPYSASKAAAEIVTQSFRDSFFAEGPPIATARAGNVIGGGDWSADRLIPDCVRALEAGRPVSLALPGRGAALAARSRAPRRLSRARAGAGALARQRAARCQFRAGCGILFDGKGGGRGIQRPLRRQAGLGDRSALPIRARRSI